VEQLRRLICLSILVLTMLGCRTEESNPEMRDLIYQDLMKELQARVTLVDESQKKVEAAEKALEKTKPRTIDRLNATSDLEKEKIMLERLTQSAEYFKIRAERRRVEGRRDYKIAFRSNKDWPDPKEYEAYLVNKRLNLVSKNWNDRVPKTIQNAQSGTAIKPKEAEGGAESPGKAVKEGGPPEKTAEASKPE
jgi:hypothetical protein